MSYHITRQAPRFAGRLPVGFLPANSLPSGKLPDAAPVSKVAGTGAAQ